MYSPFSKTAELHNATRELSDGVLQSASDAVATTRDTANSAFSRADRKARDLRASIDPAIDHLASKAQDLARQSRALAHDARAKAQQRLAEYADVTTRYVSEQPVKSVLIAAAAGAVIAALLVSRRNDNQY